MCHQVNRQRATLLFVLIVYVLPAAARGDCPGSSIDAGEVRAFIEATSLAGLDAAWQRSNHADAALSALYHRRRLDMNPTRDEELRWLQTLPATQADLDRVYQLTYTAGVCESAAVSATVYDMFETATRLAKKFGFQHGRVLSLCLFSNPEVGEVAWPACDTLLQEDPHLTVAALRKLPRALRMRYCGTDPRRLSEAAILSRCQSGL